MSCKNVKEGEFQGGGYRYADWKTGSIVEEVVQVARTSKKVKSKEWFSVCCLGCGTVSGDEKSCGPRKMKERR